MNRRRFLSTAAGAAAALSLPNLGLASGAARVKLPRWRGFNLLEKFDAGWSFSLYRESDFQMISDWGFDFVRLPMSYRCWAKPEAPDVVDEKVIEDIDRAVEWGRRYGVHVNLNLHRIPGYCVNPPAEPFDLWKDEKAQEAAAFQWELFAKRYRSIPSKQLSFDLVNEPAHVDEPTYVRVMQLLIDRIRKISPDRLIIIDGLPYGTRPVPGLVKANVGQSTRGYTPFPVSHSGAEWVNYKDFPPPAWPLVERDGKVWNKERIRREIIEPFRAIERQGVGVHVGEWGVYNKTPHDITLAYMRDYLDLWKEVGWGWALWNFRGDFGVLDSKRKDVAYEDYKGLKLDRKMLDLLRKG